MRMLINALLFTVLPLVAQAAEGELVHTPPLMRTALGVVTLEVVAPEAASIRLLTTKAEGGISALPLSDESGVFRLRTRGRDLVGRRYQFQVRQKDGTVWESSPYTVTSDVVLAEEDQLTSARLSIEALDRRIAAQRRELAMLRAQTKILAPGTDPVRRHAGALLDSQEGSHEN